MRNFKVYFHEALLARACVVYRYSNLVLTRWMIGGSILNGDKRSLLQIVQAGSETLSAEPSGYRWLEPRGKAAQA